MTDETKKVEKKEEIKTGDNDTSVKTTEETKTESSD